MSNCVQLKYELVGFKYIFPRAYTSEALASSLTSYYVEIAFPKN